MKRIVLFMLGWKKDPIFVQMLNKLAYVCVLLCWVIKNNYRNHQRSLSVLHIKYQSHVTDFLLYGSIVRLFIHLIENFNWTFKDSVCTRNSNKIQIILIIQCFRMNRQSKWRDREELKKRISKRVKQNEIVNDVFMSPKASTVSEIWQRIKNKFKKKLTTK